MTLTAGTLAAAAACLEERPRPAPPLITLAITQTVVCSPDTVRGDLQVRDPDGIDSVWITVDQREEAMDGLLEREFATTFALAVRPGLDAGTPVAIAARARDVAGFADTVRQALPVVLCAQQRLN